MTSIIIEVCMVLGRPETGAANGGGGGERRVEAAFPEGERLRGW